MTEIFYIVCDSCGDEFPVDGTIRVFSEWDQCDKDICIECIPSDMRFV